MQTPSLVGSHLHMPMAMLQQHIIMPFIIAQQLHMPPAIIEQRFCSMVADIASSHLHVIFIPPVHFSILILHRGTIIHCGAEGMPLVAPIGPAAAWPIPGIPMPARSIIIALVIVVCPLKVFYRSRLLTMDFLVASSNVGLHYRFAHLEFNIKWNEYFDAAKMSYLGRFEWNLTLPSGRMITSIPITAAESICFASMMGYLGEISPVCNSR
jgi:hypothetical protein